MGQVPHRYRDRAHLREPSGEVSNVSSFSSANEAAADQIRQEYSLTRLKRAISKLETRVTLENNQILVPVKVVYEGKTASVTMLLDTGANRTVYYASSVASLGLKAQAAGAAQVAGGGTVPTKIVKLNSVSVGPYNIKAVDSVVIQDQGSSSHGGLLGMDFLQKVTYEIDRDRSMIIWNPSKHEEMIAQLNKMQNKNEEGKEEAPAEKKNG